MVTTVRVNDIILGTGSVDSVSRTYTTDAASPRINTEVVTTKRTRVTTTTPQLVPAFAVAKGEITVDGAPEPITRRATESVERTAG